MNYQNKAAAFYIVLIAATLALVGCGKPPKGPKGDAGSNGAPGAAAPASPYDVSSVKDPCGDAPGIYDEVLLVLANKQILVSFSDNANGNNTRFVLLPPGSYRTTDGSNCYFSTDSQGNIYAEHY